jgi:hypothetical protein
LRSELSLNEEPDFDKKKINTFQSICSTTRKHLKKPRTDNQIKFCKAVARLTLLMEAKRGLPRSEI